MKKYKINKGFITQKIGNKTTVFAGEESVLFTLNESASLIFQGLKLGWDRTKIVNGLVDQYNVEKAIAQKDVEEFTKILLEKKIIKLHG